MVIYLDVGVDNDHLRLIFSVGLFRSTAVDFGTHRHREPPPRFSRNGIRIFLDLAPNHGAHDHYLRTLYALGLLPIKTVADE